jgi:hypothetical protein
VILILIKRVKSTKNEDDKLELSEVMPILYDNCQNKYLCVTECYIMQIVFLYTRDLCVTTIAYILTERSLVHEHATKDHAITVMRNLAVLSLYVLITVLSL